MELNYYEKRERAKERVAEIKAFFTHIKVYIFVNVFLLLLKGRFLDFITGRAEDLDPNFLNWLDLNILFTPLLWGFGLAIHGVYVYRHKFTFLRNWEERQLKKFLEEEESNQNQFK